MWEDMEYHLQRVQEHLDMLKLNLATTKLHARSIDTSCDRIGANIVGLCEAVDLHLEHASELRSGLSWAVDLATGEPQGLVVDGKDVRLLAESDIRSSQSVFSEFAQMLCYKYHGSEEAGNGSHENTCCEDCLGFDGWVDVSNIPSSTKISRMISSLVYYERGEE
jgi:hypothetical protein